MVRILLRGFLALGVATVVLGGGYAFAQQSGNIAGVVTDESKGVLPGVTVTGTELGSGRQYLAVTDAEGAYRLVNVQAGTFKITAELAGFATTVLPQLELLVGQSAAVPLVLKVATLEESVTVTSEAPLVDIRSSQVAGNIDRRQMEELPIPGRNWMELSTLVKGVIANDVSSQKPGTARDDQYVLNLDGQQMKQNISGAQAFGQTSLSREAIAEFQILTNLFDVTQGRSLGVSVQAITRSGTNTPAGSVYGYFRDAKFNAADSVAKKVLPFSNQQVGGAFGGPIVRDRIHYFATYEFERQPDTFVMQPASYTHDFFMPSIRSRHSLLARADAQIAKSDHLSVRFTSFIDNAPFSGVTGASYPTTAYKLDHDDWGVNGTWTRVLGASTVQEVKVGNYYYYFRHVPVDGAPDVPIYNFPGVTIGTPNNIPEEFWQDSPSVRYDLNVHKGSHELKIGGDLVHEVVTGNWPRGIRGQMTFSTLPPDFERRFPLEAWNNFSKWDFSGLDSSALFIERAFAASGPGAPGVRKGTCPDWIPNYNGCGNWTLSVPRPQIAFWINDTWHAASRLTLNLGIRHDLDWGASAPPFVKETDVVINNGKFTENIGYRNNIRDLNNFSPRVGFNYDVKGDGRLAIRGGAGVYYGVPNDNMTFNAQLLTGQRILFSTFTNDGKPGFILDPTRGVKNDDVVSGRVPLPPQAVTVFAHDYLLPTLSSTMIGVQKQIGSVMSFDTDLVYERGASLGSTRDPNLFYDPATGYNLSPAKVGRPRKDYGGVTLFDSRGRSEALQLASAFTRRYRNNFQAAAAYTLVIFRNDTGVGASGYSGTVFNNFDLDFKDNYGRSGDFQRHTLRLNALYRLPWDLNLGGTYFFGSGNFYQSLYATNLFGVGGNVGRRLRPDNTLVPVLDFPGKAIHRLDVRLSKDVKLGGSMRLSSTAEVFNLLNHNNFGGYNMVLGRSNYGQPSQQPGTAYRARTGQLGLKLSF